MSDEPMPAWARAMEERLRADAGETRAAIMARIDRLQGRVDTVHGDIRVNLARADRAEARSRGLEDIVNARADEITGMQRQIQHLQTEIRDLRGDGG